MQTLWKYIKENKLELNDEYLNLFRMSYLSEQFVNGDNEIVAHCECGRCIQCRERGTKNYALSIGTVEQFIL